MSSGSTDWLPLVLTTLGGGAVGSIITTYGTQTRERRRARAAAREALRRTESLPLNLVSHEQITAALDALETSAMLAGLPRTLTALHREARIRSWVHCTTTVTGDPAAIAQRDSEKTVSLRVARQAAELLTGATWHPWVTAPRRWHRARRLAQLLDAGMPVRAQLDRDRRSGLRKWERDTIRQGKRVRKNDDS